MDINTEIKDKLGTKRFKKVGTDTSGCISNGETYETDNGLVFVKKNKTENASFMFCGELESLNAIKATKTLRVPQPFFVISDPESSGGAFVMEYLNMNPLKEHSGKLGELLAEMHLFNAELGKKIKKNESWVGKSNEINEIKFINEFGFHMNTCCGRLPQNNEWTDNWINFYARNKLKPQLDMIESSFGDREAIDLWSKLQLNIDKHFTDIEEEIIPALLHGDLWIGNASQLAEEPVVFDAASFYGHSEFDLSIAKMFGGFNRDFYKCYHNKIPKSSKFDRRTELYQLFHCLNHWNHFGSHKHQSLSLMRSLIK